MATTNVEKYASGTGERNIDINRRESYSVIASSEILNSLNKINQGGPPQVKLDKC